MIGQLSNDEKYCPRIQGGKFLPDLRSLMDGSFYVHSNRDVKDVYSYFGGTFTKLNLTKYDTLEVDTVIAKNLFANKFTLRQTSFQNGDLMVGNGGGIIQAVKGNELTFKDQSGFNVCAFVVGDLIEAHSVRADNSLAITNPQGTVTEVIGNKVKITYYSTSAFRVGDEVYSVGNTTDATRQDSLYFSTNRTNTPYFDVYDNINSFDTVGSPTTAWTSALPKARIGKLTGITDADFGGALSGYGIYTTNAYIKGKIVMTNQGSISISGFNNDAGFITSADAGIKTTYGTTAPSTPAIGDFWYDTSITNKYIMKRWNGSAWQVVSVYADGSGLYADNITAGQITAGIFTGFSFRTDADGQSRIEINGEDDNIFWYQNADLFPTATLTAYGSYGAGGDYGLMVSGCLNVTQKLIVGGAINGTAITGTTINTDLISTSGGQIYIDSNLNISSGSIYIGANEVATQSWVGLQGYLTAETDPTIYAWAKAATKPSYTYSEVGAAASSHSHTSSNITNFAADVMTAMGGEIGEVTINYKDWNGNNASMNLLYHT